MSARSNGSRTPSASLLGHGRFICPEIGIVVIEIATAIAIGTAIGTAIGIEIGIGIGIGIETGIEDFVSPVGDLKGILVHRVTLMWAEVGRLPNTPRAQDQVRNRLRLRPRCQITSLVTRSSHLRANHPITRSVVTSDDWLLDE